MELVGGIKYYILFFMLQLYQLIRYNILSSLRLAYNSYFNLYHE